MDRTTELRARASAVPSGSSAMIGIIVGGLLLIVVALLAASVLVRKDPKNPSMEGGEQPEPSPPAP